MWQPGVNVGQGMEKTAVVAPATLWVGPMIGALAPDFKHPPSTMRRAQDPVLTLTYKFENFHVQLIINSTKDRAIVAHLSERVEGFVNRSEKF